MRYAFTQLSEVLTVAYDKRYHKTLLFMNGVSSEILAEYEKTERVARAEQIHVTTFVINITQECNLRCKYCSRYYGDYSSKHMDMDTLSSILDWIIQYSKEIKERCVVQFHGGEPTLRWKAIQEALSRITSHEIRKHLDLRIQTNGTTLTREIVAFCSQYDIHIGLSIDGPPEITNLVRTFDSGEGISYRIEKSLELLQHTAQSKTISCLCVITKNSIGKAKEVFDYIIANRINDVSILPLYNDYSCIIDDKSIIPRNEEMAAFSINIIDLWLKELMSGRILCMPSFQIWVWNLLASNSNIVFRCNSCCGAGESMLFVDMNGDLYPCGPFSYYPETKIANILDLPCDLNILSKKMQPLANRVVPECLDCGLQGVCKCGCPANSYLHFKDYSVKDPYCEYWKAVISHLLIRISEQPDLLEAIPDYTIRI